MLLQKDYRVNDAVSAALMITTFSGKQQYVTATRAIIRREPLSSVSSRSASGSSSRQFRAVAGVPANL